MWDLIKKSLGASVLIALGDYVLLKIGSPIGPFLFAFGLLGVCVLGQNLFTGKCGFWFEDHIPIGHLLTILGVNLIGGYLCGLVFSFLGDTTVMEAAGAKVEAWSISAPFFIQSVFCGIIMYLCVMVYRKGNYIGILLGVPLFIFCGFQHCIANVITMGVARSFHWSLPLCVLGNWAGSLLIWWLSKGVIKVATNKKEG